MNESVLLVIGVVGGFFVAGCFAAERATKRHAKTLLECRLRNLNLLLEQVNRRGCMYCQPEQVGHKRAEECRNRRIIQTEAVIAFLEGKEFFLL